MRSYAHLRLRESAWRAAGVLLTALVEHLLGRLLALAPAVLLSAPAAAALAWWTRPLTAEQRDEAELW